MRGHTRPGFLRYLPRWSAQTFALVNTDLQCVLAYSTIENIGVAFVALGLALGFLASGFSSAAALAMTAALFHVLNHSLFKSLLFFVLCCYADGDRRKRDMGFLGGLLNRMPVDRPVRAVGCVAISALPPLNGSVSEWLIFQATLLSPSLPSWALRKNGYSATLGDACARGGVGRLPVLSGRSGFHFSVARAAPSFETQSMSTAFLPRRSTSLYSPCLLAGHLSRPGD